MSSTKRYLLLRNQLLNHGVMLGIFIFLIICIAAYFQFQSHLEDKRNQLLTIVKLQASLMTSVASFDAMHSQTDQPQGAVAATLSQVYSALQNFQDFRETGEIVIGQDVNNTLHLFNSGQKNFESRMVIDPEKQGGIAEAMRLVLQQKTGTIIAPDYRKVTVLAAYTWMEPLQVGWLSRWIDWN